MFSCSRFNAAVSQEAAFFGSAPQVIPEKIYDVRFWMYDFFQVESFIVISTFLNYNINNLRLTNALHRPIGPQDGKRISMEYKYCPQAHRAERLVAM